jgi:hypothetical protein
VSDSSIDQIVDFVARFRSLDAKVRNERFEQFCADFTRLQTGLAPLQAQAAAELRRTARTFNLFKVLGVAYDEVRTHSALLANLLDPRGSHAQGTLFLERFLKLCALESPEVAVPLASIPSGGWIVETEKSTSQGLLDLVVSSPRLGVLYVIENKIWAGEQPQQLSRYSVWLHQQTGYPHRALFYLTPEGGPSHSHNGATYVPLSYRYHIIPWLVEALVEVEAPRIAETLNQYIEVLRAM